MAVLSGSSQFNGYKRVDKEDPDEVFRRRAQFLIYKTLEKADSLQRRRSSPLVLRIKFCKLKVRIGKRLKKLRKSMVVNIYAARLVLYKLILNKLKALKFLFSSRDKLVAAPIF